MHARHPHHAHPGPHAHAGPRGPRGHRGWKRGPGPRRPLRFLARRLELTPEQVGTVAGIFEDLRTERAQAGVDRRRSAKLYAEALAAATFDADKAAQASASAVATAERVHAARTAALTALHAVLTPEQRQKLSVVLRSGPPVW